MLKVLLMTTILSTGFTTQTTFEDMSSCLKHQQELISQKNIESSCLYTDVKPKTEMDYLVENVARKVLIVLQGKLTEVLNEHLRK